MLNQIILETRVVTNNGLKISSNDTPYIHLTLVFETRQKDGSEWKSKKNFIKASLFSKKAEALADVKPGTPLIVRGKLEQNKWESQEGEKRSDFSLTLEEFHYMNHYYQQKAEQN